MADEESSDDPLSATETGDPLDNYDIPACFAEFIACTGDLVENFVQQTLLGLFVGDTRFRFPMQSTSGAGSRVFVMRSEVLLETIFPGLDENPLPESVAVNVRMVKSENGSVEDRRPLKSLITEPRILTDKDILAHSNILTSWETAGNMRMGHRP